MASLNKTATVDDIITQLQTVYPEITGAYETQTRQFWTLVIGALYDRIEADLIMKLKSDKVNPGTLVANITTGAITGQGVIVDDESEVI